MVRHSGHGNMGDKQVYRLWAGLSGQSLPKYSYWMALLLAAMLLQPAIIAAQDKDESEAYWASIDKDQARTRTGPSQEYKIIWLYVRKNLPVKVLRRYGAWRQIEDPDGSQGWMHSRLLSRTRTALVIGDDIQDMRAKPDAKSALSWRVEPGAVGKLGQCTNGWCLLDINGRSGYIRAEFLYGTGEANGADGPGK